MQWTENLIENWLRPSTRSLTLEGGASLRLEQSTLFWKQFDALVQNQHFTEIQLVNLGYETVAEFGLPFPLAIQDAVGHLYDSWCRLPATAD